MNAIIRQLYGQRGSVGVLAVIVMVLLGVIGSAFVVLSSTENNISAKSRDGMAAEYLAEAGAQAAIVKLKKDSSFQSNTGNANGLSLASLADKNSGTATQGSYSVKVTWPGSPAGVNDRKIVSVGTVNGSARQVIVYVTAPAVGGGSGSGSGVYADGVYSSTSITVNSGGRVNGDAGTAGGITNNGTITGNQTANLTGVSFPAFSGINYGSSPQLPQNINSGSAISNMSGTYYVNSNFNIGDKLTAAGATPVIIYVNGNVNFNSGATITGNFLIVATGTISVNSTVNSAVIISLSYGDSQVNSGGKVNGAVITNGKLYVNDTVTYNSSLIQTLGLGSPASSPFTINSWNNH